MTTESQNNLMLCTVKNKRNLEDLLTNPMLAPV